MEPEPGSYRQNYWNFVQQTIDAAILLFKLSGLLAEARFEGRLRLGCEYKLVLYISLRILAGINSRRHMIHSRENLYISVGSILFFFFLFYNYCDDLMDLN